MTTLKSQKKAIHQQNYWPPNRSTSEDGNITLTEAERSVSLVQDIIGWMNFIRGLVANEFSPAIRHYYENNKMGKRFTPLQWSIEINKSNFLIHQSTLNNLWSEIATPIKLKNNRPQHKRHLLFLVEQHHKQVKNLSELQSK